MKLLKIAPVAVALSMLVACVPPSEQAARATRALSNMGMTEIRVRHAGFFLTGCSDKDSWGQSFTAVSPTGVPVAGEVCGGLFKGATVRFD